MKPFIPERGQEYHYIDDCGQVDFCNYYNNEADQYRVQTGNCYPTLEAAEYHRRMETKAWQIRQHAFEPDWSDWDQVKWHAIFSHEANKICFDHSHSESRAKIYFKNFDIARAAFEGVSNDDFIYMQGHGFI